MLPEEVCVWKCAVMPSISLADWGKNEATVFCPQIMDFPTQTPPARKDQSPTAICPSGWEDLRASFRARNILRCYRPEKSEAKSPGRNGRESWPRILTRSHLLKFCLAPANPLQLSWHLLAPLAKPLASRLFFRATQHSQWVTLWPSFCKGLHSW